jgi:predicted amidohydrolase YtcJ
MRKGSFIVCLIYIVICSCLTYGQKADLVLFNGSVFTSNTTAPKAEAIAIRGERIVAVGSNSQIKKLAARSAVLIDLKGHTVIPGINDAHFHFSPRPDGFQLQFRSMEPSWREVEDSLTAAVKQAPNGGWIFGVIGGDAVADPNATRNVLDRIVPDNPVELDTYYGHGEIVNSRAMALLNISEAEKDPLGGKFERDASGRLNGRIWEYAQWRQARNFSDMVSDAGAIARLKAMASQATRFGITSMQIMPTMRIDRFVRLLKEAHLPIRVRAMPFSLTISSGRDLSEIEQLKDLNSSGDRVMASGIKWILDGTPFEHGAALREPYNDRPDYRGKLAFSESEYPKMVAEALRLKQQLLVHCAGDKPIELLFRSMQDQKVGDWKPRRWRIEHGDALTSDLVPQAKGLGVIIVQNPTHFSLVGLIYRRYGRQTKFFSLRSLIDAGIPVALGSDGPMNPYLNIMLAASNPVRPTEAITREQAVRAYTTGSAYAEFAEGEKGILAKGKLADISVLSDDIFAMPASDMPRAHSILTILGGKIVYDEKFLH